MEKLNGEYAKLLAVTVDASIHEGDIAKHKSVYFPTNKTNGEKTLASQLEILGGKKQTSVLSIRYKKSQRKLIAKSLQEKDRVEPRRCGLGV